jgi:hypothetical protein
MKRTSTRTGIAKISIFLNFRCEERRYRKETAKNNTASIRAQAAIRKERLLNRRKRPFSCFIRATKKYSPKTRKNQ